MNIYFDGYSQVSIEFRYLLNRCSRSFFVFETFPGYQVEYYEKFLALELSISPYWIDTFDTNNSSESSRNTNCPVFYY